MTDTRSRALPKAVAALLALAAMLCVALPAHASAAVLLGDASVAPAGDTDSAGSAEAFRMTAAADGTVDTFNIYLDSASKSTAVAIGLYTDGSGHPGTLLAQAKITAPRAGAWNAVSVAATAVKAGTVYWMAALGTGGTLAFRDHCCGGGTPAESSASSSLTALPATWSAGTRWNDGSASLYGSSGTGTPPPPPPGTDTVGSWGNLMSWPLVAAHAILMKTGKVLALDGWIAPSPSLVYDPTLGGVPDGGFTRVDNPLNLDVFCSGNVTLPDGRVLLVGGHGFNGTIGIDDSTIYDPATDTWSLGPKMQYARWYPTATELGDGRIVAISGNITTTTWADTPEIYDPATNAWTVMSGVDTSAVHEEEYPLTYLLPNGKLFVIAASTGKSFLLDPDARTFSAAGTTTGRNGSAVMYRPGKILLTGGGTPLNSTNPAQKTAETIDLTASGAPAWKSASPMLAARYQHTLTMLPDGKVLAIGGGTDMDQSDLGNGELTAETWDPATGQWTQLAPMAVPRLYHSTATLMPDGRVLVAGGGHAEGTTSPAELNAQYYSPPYLFKGTRPTITSLPSGTTYGQTITVNTPDAASIASVSLVSLGADTHTLDMNQHFVPLSFTKGTGSLSVTVPSSPSVAPPGSYMLFIVNGNGVPSVAPFLKLSAATTAPTVTMTAPAAGTVSGTVTLSADATDVTGINSVQFTVDGKPVGAPQTVAPYRYDWDSTTVTNGTHTVGAIAKNGAGVSGTATPVTITTANSGLTGPIVDAQVSREGKGTQTTPAFSTTGAADVLVAFATSDGPSTGQTLTVSGGGLTWSLVKRVNARGGSTEIWSAKANAPLSGATVTATQSKTGYDQSLTVVAFTGASGVGASATANAASGAPTVSLTTTKIGSLIYGAGNDYANAVSRTVASGQAMVHEWLDTSVGDSYWVQRRTAPVSAALTTATINDTAPTGDSWNLAAVEILP